MDEAIASAELAGANQEEWEKELDAMRDENIIVVSANTMHEFCARIRNEAREAGIQSMEDELVAMRTLGRNEAVDYIQNNWGWDGDEATMEERQLKEVLESARTLKS